MSKSQGFSVQARENGLFAASVTPTGKTGWRLEALVREEMEGEVARALFAG